MYEVNITLGDSANIEDIYLILGAPARKLKYAPNAKGRWKNRVLRVDYLFKSYEKYKRFIARANRYKERLGVWFSWENKEWFPVFDTPFSVV